MGRTAVHIIPLTSISKGVYLSTCALLTTPTQLNIQAIVECSPQSRPAPLSVPLYTVYSRDDPHEDIKCFFDPAITFVQESLRRGNVLISSTRGSCSAAIAIAYLMRTQKMCLQSALQLVLECGSQRPNHGFQAQLEEYAQSLGMYTPIEVVNEAHVDEENCDDIHSVVPDTFETETMFRMDGLL